MLPDTAESSVSILADGACKDMKLIDFLEYATVFRAPGSLYDFGIAFNGTRPAGYSLCWTYRDGMDVPVAAGILYPIFGLLLSPMIAAAAMSLSSVSVIGNALRLRGLKL